MNASLITGLIPQVAGIAVSGDDLFVANGDRVSEYTTSGTLVNASLITAFGTLWGLAVSGDDLFIANWSGNAIGEYTTSGAVVNASLVSGVNGPTNIALAGSDLFVAIGGAGGPQGVAEYTTSGTTVSASLIAGPVNGIAVSVPEPTSFVLAAAGLLGLIPLARRRKGPRAAVRGWFPADRGS